MAANNWISTSTTRKRLGSQAELVDRKVKALLNKLTMEKFESISDQIIHWVNKGVNEKDGRTLIQVIRLVFQKAIDEAAWSEMYARLCRKMMEQISPEVQDDGIKNSDGKPIAGGQLFRKYLSRCQEDFERGWVAKEATAAAAAAKASDDQATKDANEKKETEEAELYSEEYYAAQKAKRQGLGLIKFIGELFKLQMLTERIMHECVKKLLGNVENPKEEEIESLCQLLKTVGQLLDRPMARAHMDVYFTRMKVLGKSLNVSSRMQFMLQDVIELRDRKWVARNAIAAPTTIAAVREATPRSPAFSRAVQSVQSQSRQGAGPGGPGGPPMPASPRMVSHQHQGPPGGVTQQMPMQPMPWATYNYIPDPYGQQPPSWTYHAMPPQHMHQQPHQQNVHHAAPPHQPGPLPMSPRPAAPQLPGTPTMAHAAPHPPHTPQPPPSISSPPRSILSAEENTTTHSEEEPETAPTTMSEADVKKKIDEHVKEFFAVRNLEEADVYFTNLPDEHRFRLVDKLVASALESKEADARLVGDFFARAMSHGQCTLEVFEEGFTPMAELLDDTAIDAPKAFDYMAIMLRGAGFEKDPERLQRIASKLEDSDKLVSLVA